jgi:hypothetical protein
MVNGPYTSRKNAIRAARKATHPQAVLDQQFKVAMVDNNTRRWTWEPMIEVNDGNGQTVEAPATEEAPLSPSAEPAPDGQGKAEEASNVVPMRTSRDGIKAPKKEKAPKEKKTKEPKAATAIDQKVMELCGRREGASRKELFAATGWNINITPVVVLRTLAKRFNLELSQEKGEDKHTRYHLHPKAEEKTAE